MTILVAALVVGTAVPTLQSSPHEAVVLRLLGSPAPDVRQGIELGLHEMAQTARLLQREVHLVEGGTPDPGMRFAALVADGTAERIVAPDVPAVHLGRLPHSAGRCEFSMAAPVRHTLDTVLWHPSLARFGASELNERFRRRSGSEMSAGAWTGWAAVKALVEAALRQRDGEPLCASLARLRFDGHKGRPLFFDPGSRWLAQPVYVVREGGLVEEVK